MKELLKTLIGDWRMWILLFAIAVSVFSLSPNLWASGVVVNSVKDDSPFQGRLEEGTVIRSVNGETISSPRDLKKFSGFDGVLKLRTSKGLKLVDVANQSLGIRVDEVKKINLNFGMDLVGGTRVLLEPLSNRTNETPGGNVTGNVTKNQSQEIGESISILKTRLDVFGLKNMRIGRARNLITGQDFIEIKAPGVQKKVVEELLNRKGEFEAYIRRVVQFGNSTDGVLGVGEKNYTFTRKDNLTQYSSKSLEVNDTLELNNVTFEVWNITPHSLVMGAKIYGSDDIRHVYTMGQKSFIRQRGGTWRFRFKVLVSQDGISRFAKVTQNLEEIERIGEQKRENCYLSERIQYFIDEKPVDVLNLPCDTKGEKFNPWITGGAKKKEGALEEMKRLQSIMKSGKLPIKLQTVKVESISPTLGREMLRSAGIAGVGALIAVAFMIFFRYRTKKIILPVLITSFSEVLIILGAASLIGRTIDLPAIAGIIAAIGSSVDDQIVITSETLEGEKGKSKYSVKRRVKRAFFIVFVAAATTIVAMMTLAYIGVGAMRGFAIMTIIGVLAGVFITRPAYGRILEEVL